MLEGLQPVFLLGEAEHTSPGEPGRGRVCEAVGLWEELEGWGKSRSASLGCRGAKTAAWRGERLEVCCVMRRWSH